MIYNVGYLLFSHNTTKNNIAKWILLILKDRRPLLILFAMNLVAQHCFKVCTHQAKLTQITSPDVLSLSKLRNSRASILGKVEQLFLHTIVTLKYCMHFTQRFFAIQFKARINCGIHGSSWNQDPFYLYILNL